MSGSEATDLTDRVKAVHRRFPTGVTVVTTNVDGVPYGLAVNAFSSISLSPPLVLVCVAESASTYTRLFVADRVAVNILAAAQIDVARTFAKSGGDKFAELSWQPGSTGSPVLDGVAAYFELEIETRMPAYTHTIFVGRVVNAEAFERAPLVYLGGRFYDGEQLAEVA